MSPLPQGLCVDGVLDWGAAQAVGHYLRLQLIYVNWRGKKNRERIKNQRKTNKKKHKGKKKSTLPQLNKAAWGGTVAFSL